MLKVQVHKRKPQRAYFGFVARSIDTSEKASIWILFCRASELGIDNGIEVVGLGMVGYADKQRTAGNKLFMMQCCCTRIGLSIATV